MILVAGPEDEVERAVRWIYSEFLEGGKAESDMRLATFCLRNEAYNATLRKQNYERESRYNPPLGGCGPVH